MESLTISDRSAGGASVDLYNYAYVDDPIIAGSIAQSGTASSFGNSKLETANKNWGEAASKVGCNQTNADEILACMRSPNVTMENLVQAQSAGSGLGSVLGNFGPTVDGKIVFENYTELALQNRYLQKPYIFGNNNNEAGLFKLIAAGSGSNISDYEWNGFNYGEFVCPASTAAAFRAGSGVPTWRYIYGANFPNLKLPTDDGQAWHGAELLPLFGSSEDISKQDSTWQERAMGSYLRGAWSAFVHDPVNGLASYGWDHYSNTTNSLLQLGFDNTSSPTFSVLPTYNVSSAYDGLCGAFPYGGAANR